MAKLEIKNWKSYKVGDLFSATRGISFKMQGLDYGEIPVIAAARYNHGVAGYYKVKPMYKNAITISCNGVGCGSTYYHDYEFAMTGDAIVLLDKINIPDGAKPFIASVYDKYFNSKYSYGDKCSADRAEAEIIRLPSKNNNPDWEYMESYMRNIIQESEQNIENLRNINNSKKKINLNNWKSFTIGKLFENVVKPPVLHTKDVTENVNGIPYVVRTKFDNGIKYNVEKKLQMQSSPAGTISFGAENATFFYQEKEYVSGRDIYYIDTRYLTKYACLFVVTCLQTIVEKYSYNYGMFPELVKKEEIKLPVNKNGEPDWEFMENYMKNIMQESEWNIQKIQKLDCCK